MAITRILFVCLGNICRSPTAEGVFRDLVAAHKLDQQIQVDSAGTGNWHIGHAPDGRAIEAARSRGIDISHLRARQVKSDDFAHFDYIIAMDFDNYTNLASLAKTSEQNKLHLFLSFAQNSKETQVPDPYFGGDDGFPRVLNLIEDASLGLLNHIITSSRDAN